MKMRDLVNLIDIDRYTSDTDSAYLFKGCLISRLDSDLSFPSILLSTRLEDPRRPLALTEHAAG
jgi:hypothetical protein